MHFNLRKREFSIFYKLILMFFLVIIPLSAISFGIIKWGETIIRNEISLSINSQVQFYLDAFDKDINRIYNMQREYINDDDLQKLSIASPVMNNFEKTQATYRILRQLQLMKNSSLYIKNASVHIPSINRTISTSNAVSEILLEKYAVLKKDINISKIHIVNWEDRLFITAFPHPPIPTLEDPIFFLEIELSVQEINDELIKFIDYSRGGTFLMDKKGAWIIANQKNISSISYLKNHFRDLGTQNINEDIIPLKINDEKFIVTYKSSKLLDTILVGYIPEKQVLGVLMEYQNWFWFLTFVSLIIILFFSYWIYRAIHKPVRKLVAAFGEVDKGEFNISLKRKANDEFAYLYSQFNKMTKNLSTLIHEVYEQKISLQRSELKQLQSQINPHFLYNSFFVLYQMTCIKDYDNVSRFTKYLGEYFQTITRNGSEEITLEMEMKHVKTYIDIQTIRFSNRIHVEINEIPTECKNILVPRLLLQPIIENAYVHGMKNTVSGGLIIAQISNDNERLIFSVEDNGQEMGSEKFQELLEILSSNRELGEITGLINVNRRLKLKYGSEARLLISNSMLGGLKVEIWIPLKEIR